MARRGRVASRTAPLRPGRGRRRPWLLAVVLCVVALLSLVAAWMASQGSASNTGGLAGFPATPTPQPTRTPLATPIPGSGTVAIAPTPAPTETAILPQVAATLPFPSTSGPPVALRSLHGKKVVLYFYEEST